MPDEHAPISPSGAHRWFACPGSVHLSAGVESEDSEYAAEGTFAHEVAARLLLSGHDARSVRGETDLRFTVDDDMAAAIQEYLDAVRGEMRGVFHKFIERRVSPHPRYDDILWGTADSIVVRPKDKELHVFDYKHGAGVLVEVALNPQLRIYGLGALRLVHGRFGRYPEKVTLHVVQPRHALGGHRCEELTTDDLVRWDVDVLRPAVEAVQRGSGPLRAGDHCRFCPVKANCPELRRTALEVAKNVFKGDDLTAPRTEPLPPAELTSEEIAQVLKAVPLVQEWINAVRDEAYRRAQAGDPPSGWKLVDTWGNRAWRDPETAELLLSVILDDPHAAPKLLSPAQAEKRLPKDMRPLVKRLAHKPKRAPALARLSDPRPAIGPAADVFDDDRVRKDEETKNEEDDPTGGLFG